MILPPGLTHLEVKSLLSSRHYGLDKLPLVSLTGSSIHSLPPSLLTLSIATGVIVQHDLTPSLTSLVCDGVNGSATLPPSLTSLSLRRVFFKSISSQRDQLEQQCPQLRRLVAVGVQIRAAVGRSIWNQPIITRRMIQDDSTDPIDENVEHLTVNSIQGDGFSSLRLPSALLSLVLNQSTLCVRCLPADLLPRQLRSLSLSIGVTVSDLGVLPSTLTFLTIDSLVKTCGKLPASLISLNVNELSHIESLPAGLLTLMTRSRVDTTILPRGLDTLACLPDLKQDLRRIRLRQLLLRCRPDDGVHMLVADQEIALPDKFYLTLPHTLTRLDSDALTTSSGARTIRLPHDRSILPYNLVRLGNHIIRTTRYSRQKARRRMLGGDN